jgi:hypothetical protein
VISARCQLYGFGDKSASILPGFGSGSMSSIKIVSVLPSTSASWRAIRADKTGSIEFRMGDVARAAKDLAGAHGLELQPIDPPVRS